MRTLQHWTSFVVLFEFLGRKSPHGNADRELMIMKFPGTILLEQISATEKQDVEIRLETD